MQRNGNVERSGVSARSASVERAWRPACLSVASGNVSMDMLLGSLFALEKKGLLESVKSYASSGNGCFISVLLCLGLSLDEIKISLSNKDMLIFLDSQLYHALETDVHDVPALDQFIWIKEFFTEIFETYATAAITFDQLYLKTGKHLYLTTYNLTTETMIYLSKDNSPNMKIIDAIVLTTGIFHINTHTTYNGDLYIDASSSNPLPISCFNRDRKVLALRTKDNDNQDKIEVKTDYRHARLALKIAIERLTVSAFRTCIMKSLFITMISSQETAPDAENIIINGYEQTLKGLKQFQESEDTTVTYNSSKN